MASYENLMGEQLLQHRPAVTDAWYYGDFGEGTDLLVAAIRSSFCGDSSRGDAFPAENLKSPVAKQAVSVGTEGHAAVPKRRAGGVTVPPSGGVLKRKSRGSRRSATTTFIVADPENFRRMVQQVTGAKVGGSDEPAFEPERTDRVVNLGGGLPTRDASAFLPEGLASSAPGSQPSSMSDGGGSAAGERLFDSFCSFPTLESWSSWKAV